MDRLEHDIRIALRGFRHTPSFTITAILILAVGIGMAVAMFTVYDAVLVRNLPVRDQDRVVELYTYRGDPKTDYWLQRADLRTIASASRLERRRCRPPGRTGGTRAADKDHHHRHR